MIEDLFDKNLMKESEDDFEPDEELYFDEIKGFRAKRLYVAS